MPLLMAALAFSSLIVDLSLRNKMAFRYITIEIENNLKQSL